MPKGRKGGRDKDNEGRSQRTDRTEGGENKKEGGNDKEEKLRQDKGKNKG